MKEQEGGREAAFCEVFDSLGLRKKEQCKVGNGYEVWRVEDASGNEWSLKLSRDLGVKEGLQTQSIAEIFFRTLDHNLHIPKGEYLEKDSIGILKTEWIEGRPIAPQGEPITNEITAAELKHVTGFISALNHVEFRELPEEIQEQARSYSKDVLMERSDAHLENIPTAILADAEKEAARNALIASDLPRGLDHHDTAYWNFIRTEDGSLALLDAEYARWGMKWYDVAYTYIQAAVFGQVPKKAKEQLLQMVEQLEAEFPGEQIRKDIMTAMQYRILVNLNECQQNEVQVRVAKELFDKIVTGDFDQIVA